MIKHQIKLKPGTQPRHIPANRLQHWKLATVDQIINEMFSQDEIESSNSKWHFSLILVPKSNGTVRPAISYSTMNTQTIPDILPSPIISDILRSLGTEKALFSTTDSERALWKIELQHPLWPSSLSLIQVTANFLEAPPNTVEICAALSALLEKRIPSTFAWNL